MDNNKISYIFPICLAGFILFWIWTCDDWLFAFSSFKWQEEGTISSRLRFHGNGCCFCYVSKMTISFVDRNQQDTNALRVFERKFQLHSIWQTGTALFFLWGFFDFDTFKNVYKLKNDVLDCTSCVSNWNSLIILSWIIWERIVVCFIYWSNLQVSVLECKQKLQLLVSIFFCIFWVYQKLLRLSAKNNKN